MNLPDMKPWDLNLTRERVRVWFGEEQLQLARPCFESVAERRVHAAYHFQEFKKLLKTNIDDRLDTTPLIRMALLADGEEFERFNLTMAHTSANILACLHAMHALGDLLAGTVYVATGQNLGPYALAERAVSFGRVIGILKRQPQYLQLAALLAEFQTNAEFVYLAGLVNHAKHRSIIGTTFLVEGSKTYKLLFNTFSYEGRQYEKRGVPEYLEPAYLWLSKQIVACGHALNDALDPATSTP
jgi:hypothetical protein